MSEASSAAPHEPLWREIWNICLRGRQLWKLIPRRQRWTLLGAVGLMILGGISNTAIPLILGKLVDTVQHLGPTDQGIPSHAKVTFYQSVGLILGLIGLAYVIREGLQVARRYLVEDTSTRLEKHLFITLINHLLMADLSTFTEEKIGTLHGKMLRNINGSVRFLRVGFLDFLPAVLTGSLALIAATTKQPWLGLVMAGAIPISFVLTLWQLSSQKGVRLALMRDREELDGTVVEQLTGIDYIRAANTHQREVNRVDRSAEALRSKELHHHFIMSLYGAGKALSDGFFHIVVLALAVHLAAIGKISFGDILTFSMLFLNVMAPLYEVHRVIDEGHESSLIVAELLSMLEEPLDRSYETGSAARPRLDLQDGVIRVQDLHVQYTTGRRHALDGVSLVIRHGEIVGIAGRSGCGKSTLLRTLIRLIHPTTGEAQVAGIPLSSVSRQNIAELVGYVGQSPFIFAGTVADNIAYERLNSSRDEVCRAATMACLHDEIMEMPHGYDSSVVEGGRNLSGGQRQRLALARVLLKNPPILILDEATSALDTISERRIHEALVALRGDRTVILVAHRLSTLLNADRILVFDHDKIVEEGTHDELVARGGLFAELVNSAESSPHAQRQLAAAS
ncbi:MAG TPA: ABC transporter ATP-binding protein [Pirellulales bacterium]|jgi:ATP-binding cassette subfamily B protein|nr:ABC transporter ATP-binding protein [Pirellulales bacterium]